MDHGLRDDKGLAWRLYLGFGCAYFMSYAFRVVNSIIGPDLALELHFTDGDLGLLTSTYLLSFGLLAAASLITLSWYGIASWDARAPGSCRRP